MGGKDGSREMFRMYEGLYVREHDSLTVKKEQLPPDGVKKESRKRGRKVRQVDHETIASGYHGNLHDETYRTINTGEEWKDYVNTVLRQNLGMEYSQSAKRGSQSGKLGGAQCDFTQSPESLGIDFARDTVLCASMGLKTRGGGQVLIDEVVEYEDRVEVSFWKINSKRGASHHLNTPYCIDKIPKTTKKIEFRVMNDPPYYRGCDFSVRK